MTEFKVSIVNEFTASNDWVVKPRLSGNVDVLSGSGTLCHYLTPAAVTALREYFLQDVELPDKEPFEHDGYLVMPRPSRDDLDDPVITEGHRIWPGVES